MKFRIRSARISLASVPVIAGLSILLTSFDFAQNEMAAKVSDLAHKFSKVSVPADCETDAWIGTSTTNAPTARSGHTAVWTGSEMIVWGGFNSGGRYDPTTNSWTATSIVNAPAARSGHTTVWTGTEMIVWGGYGDTYFNSGGRYNPATDTWIATTTANAPSAREAHVAVWTGTEMIVWGGTGYSNTGARYNPTSDSWTSMSIPPIAARVGHTAVWDGSEMIVWGGSAVPDGYTNTGARYNPKTDSWTLTSTMNAPAGRAYQTAIWTGSEMIIWGGGISTGALQTGGRYNPITDSWLPTRLTNAPAARYSHTAVWVGNEMIVWGGYGTTSLNTGGRYNASSDTWIATSTFNVPTAREAHTAVWTGNQMIVWGGEYYHNGNVALNTGGRYCAQPQPPFAESALSRKNHGAAGTFDVDLPLTGTPGLESRTGGATNDHVMFITFSVNVTVNGNPQAAVTSGVGTVGSNGMSNGGMVSVNGNLVMVPLTNVANAQTINVTLYAINGGSNVVIPMNLLAGDVNNSGSVNASDVAFTKMQIGHLINQANFRADVNAGGAINASDVSAVKSHVGTALP